MAEVRKICDVYQGYNFKKDQQSTVGFITAISIGGTALAADQTVKDPTNSTTDLPVVAVLADVLWETGVTDAVYFTGQISIANQQNVALMVISDMTKIDVTFQFAVYDYDPLQKAYYQSFYCNSTTMNGLLEKNGRDLNLSVADDASTEVQSPMNYRMNVGIKPQPSAQTLFIATSVNNKIAKSWGLKVGS